MSIKSEVRRASDRVVRNRNEQKEMWQYAGGGIAAVVLFSVFLDLLSPLLGACLILIGTLMLYWGVAPEIQE